MKRFIWLLLAMFLLAGCNQEVPETTVPTTTQPAPTGIYRADSRIEQETDGAVRAYDLEENGYFALSNLGNKLLAFGSNGRIDAFSGEEMMQVASAVTENSVRYDTPVVSVSALGVAYYRTDTREVILLNPMLGHSDSIKMPEDAEGDPIVSLDRGEIYYCAGQQIRALNMQTGVSRIVRTCSGKSLTITNIYFEGSILSCVQIDQVDREQTLYISTDTGATISTDREIKFLTTSGGNYFLDRKDNLTDQTVFGKVGEEPLQFYPDGSVTALPEIYGALEWSLDNEKLTMWMYDLETGTKTGYIQIPEVSIPLYFLGCPEDGSLWILLKDVSDNTMLYRWDPDKTPVEDDKVYTSQMYTAESPDEEGLAVCVQRAQELSQQYGVSITVWQDALEQTGDYTMTAEYQVDAVTEALDQLETALAIFPEDVFTESLQRGDIHIALVRSISDDLQAVHFWKNNDAYISITVGDHVAGELIHQIAYTIDSHTTAYSKNYDLWNALNPDGFTYELSYILTGDRADNAYLTGEDRAFVDNYSMTFPIEDRCTIFYMACQEGNEALFAAPVLQNKLRTICRSVREAYALEKHPEPFLWEQYLEEPLV